MIFTASVIDTKTWYRTWYYIAVEKKEGPKYGTIIGSYGRIIV